MPRTLTLLSAVVLCMTACSTQPHDDVQLEEDSTSEQQFVTDVVYGHDHGMAMTFDVYLPSHHTFAGQYASSSFTQRTMGSIPPALGFGEEAQAVIFRCSSGPVLKLGSKEPPKNGKSDLQQCPQLSPSLLPRIWPGSSPNTLSLRTRAIRPRWSRQNEESLKRLSGLRNTLDLDGSPA